MNQNSAKKVSFVVKSTILQRKKEMREFYLILKNNYYSLWI